jgi:thymidylate kinase
MKKYKLIIFEGIDGSGKSTQARYFAKNLNAFYFREPKFFKKEILKKIYPLTELFLFLSDRSEVYSRIKNLRRLNGFKTDHHGSTTDKFGFETDNKNKPPGYKPDITPGYKSDTSGRHPGNLSGVNPGNNNQHKSVPNPHKSAFIVLDRSFPSTLAYQLMGRNLKKLISIDDYLKIDFLARQKIEPDLVIVFDVPVDIALKRLKKKTKFEEKKFLMKVRKAYLNLAKKFNWYVVDGTKDKNTVRKNIWLILKEKGLLKEKEI